jgi:hypothetical protein
LPSLEQIWQEQGWKKGRNKQSLDERIGDDPNPTVQEPLSNQEKTERQRFAGPPDPAAKSRKFMSAQGETMGVLRWLITSGLGLDSSKHRCSNELLNQPVLQALHLYILPTFQITGCFGFLYTWQNECIRKSKKRLVIWDGESRI